jgi:hypothetical protein
MANIFFPVLNAVDAFLAHLLPAWLVLSLWGVVSGVIVMGVYYLASPQKRIGKKKDEIKALQIKLKEAGDDFKLTLSLSAQNLGKAFELLAMVILPALLSAVPAIILLAWVSTAYSYDPVQPGSTVTVEPVPAGHEIAVEPPERLVGQRGANMVLTTDEVGAVSFMEDGKVIYRTAFERLPAGTVGKRFWWNVLWEDDNGYLSDGAGIDEMQFGVPRRQLIGGVPDWMGTWEFPYFLLLCVSALGMKFIFKIH